MTDHFSDIRFNPYVPGFYDNPYPAYDRLREADPCHLSFMGAWIMSRYEDVAAGLLHPDLSSDMRTWQGFYRRYNGQDLVSWFVDHALLTMDPPHHGLLKSVLSRSFLASAQAVFDQLVPAICTSRLDAILAKRRVDFIADYALAVPLDVIFHLFEVPDADRAQVKRWSSQVSRLIEPLPNGPELGQANDAILAFSEYLQTRAKAGSLSLLSQITRLSQDALYAGRDYLLPNLVLLFMAGHETTVNLLGNGLWALLQNPQSWASIDPDDRKCIERLVEEMLRYDPPQQLAWRTARRDLEIGGFRFSKGDQIMFLIGAANRDPIAFDAPGTFRPDRAPNPHLSFGRGPHACIGAWFARAQGRTAFAHLLRRIPLEQLVFSNAKWSSNFSFRGLEHLTLDIAHRRRATTIVSGDVRAH